MRTLHGMEVKAHALMVQGKPATRCMRVLRPVGGLCPSRPPKPCWGFLVGFGMGLGQPHFKVSPLKNPGQAWVAWGPMVAPGPDGDCEDVEVGLPNAAHQQP